METLKMVVDLINTCGFPIACVIALAWYAKNTTDKMVELTREVTRALVSSTDTMEEIKDVIQKLVERS